MDAARVRERLGRRSIVFVGLMGAGKTAIGRKVSSLLELEFTDSDHEIETVSRMTIPELFETYGESEFRDLENRVISRLLRSGPRVLSTGGGAFVSERVRRSISRHGISIWLKADLDVLMERVKRRKNRPLLKTEDPEQVMRKLMETRYPLYQLADITICSRDVAKETIAAEAVEALELFLNNRNRRRSRRRN